MERQKSEPNIKVLTIFIGIIIFFYLNYSVLFFLKNFKLQLFIFAISGYLLICGIYRYLPIYIYELKAHELLLIRQFSERYFDDCLIKVEDIKSFSLKNKKSLKFWNKFYNNNANKYDIYCVTTDDLTLEFKPNKKVIEILEKNIEKVALLNEK